MYYFLLLLCKDLFLYATAGSRMNLVPNSALKKWIKARNRIEMWQQEIKLNQDLFSGLKEKKLLEANEATLAMLYDQFPGFLIMSMIWRVLLKLQSVGLVLCKPTSKSMQCYVGTANGNVCGHKKKQPPFFLHSFCSLFFFLRTQ